MNIGALMGTVTRDPRVTYQEGTGQQVVSLTLSVEEPRPTGDPFKTYIAIECYGRSAAQAETLSTGTLVAVEGKIGWKAYTHKGEKRSTLVVLARQVRELARQHDCGTGARRRPPRRVAARLTAVARQTEPVSVPIFVPVLKGGKGEEHHIDYLK